MAIAFRSLTSQAYASRTNTTLTAPAGLADGDILVAVIITAKATTAPTPTPPAGFTSFGTATSVTDSGSFNGRMNIFWKRAASESGSYTFTHAVASSNGILAAYSGCLASGTPLGATSNNTGNDITSTGTGITTTAANSFLLWVAHNWTGNAATPPSGMTERYDALGYLADQLIASAGATGNRSTATNGNAAGGDQWAVRMVELLVDTGGGGPSTGTLSSTLAAATAAATGTVLVSGTAANTLGALTSTSTGKVAVSATAANTLGALTGTLTGKVTVSGSYVGTLFPMMLSATGTVTSLGTTGTLTATLGTMTMAGAGVVTTPARTATLNATLAPLTLLAVALPQRFATLNVALDQMTMLARGHVPAWWTKSPQLGEQWVVLSGDNIRRFVQDGRLRVTEQGAVRIVERRKVTWRTEPTISNPWH